MRTSHHFVPSGDTGQKTLKVLSRNTVLGIYGIQRAGERTWKGNNRVLWPKPSSLGDLDRFVECYCIVGE